ncbi:MAG: type II toxin-antitoxin system VapC family toxin [Methermicoccaceae archaeon]
MALADTSFLIDLMKKDAGARKLYNRVSTISIPSVVVAELMAGVEKKGNSNAIRRVDNFLSAFMCAGFTCEVAREYGKLYALLYSKGKPIPEFDMMIAATALHHGEPLITKDKHFREVPGLEVIEY